MSDPLLEVRGLTRRFGGAGKSTLFGVAAGVYGADGGEVQVEEIYVGAEAGRPC